MARGTLRIWATVVVYAIGIGALSLSADEPHGPNTRQTKALASLTAPALPGSFAVAAHSTPNAGRSCVQDLDHQIRPLSVSFSQGSTAISTDDGPLLRHIAALISNCDEAHVQVAGHADGTGDDRTNIALSWERADEALAALVMLGVDPASLEAIGYGARVPLSQGSNEGSAANRRVDFRVMRKRD